MKKTNSSQALGLLIFICLLLQTAATDLHVPSQYPTISNAVRAARSGDTVRIAPGDFYEQFVIAGRTNLILQGEPGSVLHVTEQMEQTLFPYDGLAYAIIGVVRGSEVTVRGLEFDGHRLADSYSSALVAVVFRGSSGRIENCNFKGFRGSFLSQARAINVENHLTDGSKISNIGIFNSAFSDNQVAITVWGAADSPGSLRTTFTLEGNNIRGAEFTDVISGGVAISFGVEAAIKRNRITDHVYDLGIVVNDRLFAEHGSFYPTKRVIVSENTFSNNAVHLAAIQANNIVITNNIFEKKAQDARAWGVTITGTNVVVADNDFADMPQGIALPAGELLQGVSRGTVFNVSLAGNWFTNVPNALVTNAAVRGLQESGTELSEFPPKFVSLNLNEADKIRASVRTWHGKPITIESSKDLREWTPQRAEAPTLPISEFDLGHDTLAVRGFFRLRINP